MLTQLTFQLIFYLIRLLYPLWPLCLAMIIILRVILRCTWYRTMTDMDKELRTRGGWPWGLKCTCTRQWGTPKWNTSSQIIFHLRRTNKTIRFFDLKRIPSLFVKDIVNNWSLLKSFNSGNNRKKTRRFFIKRSFSIIDDVGNYIV